LTIGRLTGVTKNSVKSVKSTSKRQVSKPKRVPDLILIGLRASGKSTIGKLLAKSLRRKFIDLDNLTAFALNAPTAGDALERQGVDAFRAAEAAALAKVLANVLNGRAARRPIMLALGGGTPTAPGAAELLAHVRDDHACTIVYLRANATTLTNRTRNSSVKRPSLTSANQSIKNQTRKELAAEVATLLRQRDRLYRSLASHILRVDTKTDAQVHAAILELVRV